ncbi:uncharacterized protein EI90DRAFT_3057282 [Cantharellus anzutake]|uniref:uncharacterized protein n=1 Tax=Cantharellus anzutake TaxID=1750568 RepID=UPI00190398D1|nr:uncharacterized protein EI90DRAFT_3057282 [Cantharellus anzutake]KAF8331775.1 hypothetical protein EI90DRAFT_3057282 [Cantharellus anzutake]
MEELRQVKSDHEAALGQLRRTHLNELAERDAELEHQRLSDEEKLAVVTMELEQLRPALKGKDDELGQQRQEHAERIAKLEEEIETRKIEALAAQFPTASKLLITAYIRLECLGKRKREDLDGGKVVRLKDRPTL